MLYSNWKLVVISGMVNNSEPLLWVVRGEWVKNEPGRHLAGLVVW